MSKLIDGNELLEIMRRNFNGAMTPEQHFMFQVLTSTVEEMAASRSPAWDETQKQIAELQYQYDKERSDNKKLKECIVRMSLGKYGVLNE